MLKCIKCNDIFRTRHDLEYHVKRDHQSSVKVKFQNGEMTEVKKRMDDTFKCTCEKSFKLPDSLQRHGKSCRDELTEPEEDEEEGALMDVLEDSDMSESMDVDGRVIPADCFGSLISHEKC